MIHTIRTVAVGDQESKIDSPIILYRGDREVEVEFTINGSKFTFTNGGNVIKSTNATHGQLVINTPTGENMFSEVTECHDGKVVFVITKEMIDELIEVGFYSFQIRLFDEDQVSRVTIPPVLKGIDIRNPIAAEDETNLVDVALVDYSVVIKDEFEDLSTFLPDGNYNKTEWESKDVISGAKLNKIEDALYNINSNMEASDLNLLNRIENNVIIRLNVLEGVNADNRLDVLEGVNAGSRLDILELDIKNRRNYVTYEEFGAKGDGVSDDGPAIKAAHEYANRNNLKVMATGTTYYIKYNLDAEIQTNTDFNNATFIIDDSLSEIDRKLPIFKVTSKHETFSIDTGGIIINKNTKQISQLSGYGDCLVEVLNDNKKQYIRKGENADAGDSQCDYFTIDNDGNVMNDIIWDFDNITEINLYPIDDDFLIINNGKFITKTNNKHQEQNYFERGFLINRSNVIIDNINHDLTDEVSGAPYYGFIHAVRCSNLYVKNCLLQSHIAYKNVAGVNMGSYDMRFERSTNIRLDNVIDKGFNSVRTRWGILSSFYVKDVYVEKCRIGRFDAHTGVHNLTIRDCNFGWQAISLVGSGLCLVENVNISNAQYIIYLRPDYGSNWNGDMILKNIRLTAREMTFTPKIIHFENDGTHDFGYECHHPKRIVMEDIFIDDTRVLSAPDGTYENMFVVFNIEDYTGVINDSYQYPYIFSETIECKNLKTKSGRGFKIFPSSTYNMYGNSEFEFNELGVTDIQNKHLDIKTNLNIILDNVELTNYEGGSTRTSSDIFGYPTSIDADSDGFMDNPHRVLPNITIKNSGNVFAYTGDHPIVLEIDNCTVRNLVMVDKSARNAGRVINCTFKPDLSISDVAVRVNWGSFKFLHSYFDVVRIGGSVVSDITSIKRAYAFLSLFTLIRDQYVHARLIMSNCGIFSFNFHELNNKLVDCRFRFGNHHFEYYLPSSGTFADKPDPAYVTIPVGFCYYVVSSHRYILWDGYKWVYLKDETDV